MNTTATITKTAKGYRVDYDGRTVNVGAAFTHVVIYPTGGWNTVTKASDSACMSKHKSAAAAFKTARESVEWNGAGVVYDLEAGEAF